MMKRKIQLHTLTIILILLHSSCEKVTDFYIGIPLQPEITENTFKEGMNIFGLLRPDSYGEFNKSFVYVQQNWPVLEFNDSSFTIIKYADIQLIRLEDNLSFDTIYFPLMSPDSSFSDTLYRPVQPYIPIPGNTYRLICSHDSLPRAIGETLFPNEPLVVPGSIKISDRNIRFEVGRDETIKMMDIYLVCSTCSGFAGRYVTSDTTNISITLPISGVSQAIIEIYGYDANLAAYYANSNTSLNFNKYRTTFSTMEEGFGVFGSLNFTKFSVEIP